MSKKIKLIAGIALLALLTYLIYYTWETFPAISGYGAKHLCSCMFVAGREEKDVIQDELSGSIFSLGTYKANKEDSSVTSTVFGFAKRKAIFRKGLGCTLVNEISEKELRSQLFITNQPSQINTDSIAWPQGDKISDTIPSYINIAQLKQAVDNAFAEDPDKKTGTRAIVILYDGKLIAEQYAPGFDRHSKMLGWSVAKSITGALIGILVKQHKLVVNEPAPVPLWNRKDPRHQITLEHLLQQTSGLDFKENYSKPSEVITMLFSKGDMAAYAAGLPLKNSPGSEFNYSGGNTNILQGIIRRTLGQNYYRFPYDSLFNKIGMYSALLEPDASGTFIGSTYIYATARDYARFGLLYYNEGVWNGNRILPEGWVQKSYKPSAADKRKHYGYQFWLNGFDKDLSKRWYPGAPADMYFADGFNGQEIYIIPSKKLVIVRLGLKVLDENKFLKETISALPK